MLGKIDNPGVDPRCPYTEIDKPSAFSGRSYDEGFVTAFINTHRLPCNSTTAFLTPALRNIDRPLTTNLTIVGRPTRMYSDSIEVLHAVAKGRVAADAVLYDIIRLFVLIREENAAKMEALLSNTQQETDGLPLSSEQITTLIGQHSACRNSSRLPVLVVAAVYHAASGSIGETIRGLHAHNAADEQTGALGDIEICLESETKVVTAYEMKMKRVTIDDIDRAVTKIANQTPRIDNYIFITTDVIEDGVTTYAASIYERLGAEVAILDCMGFLRHFLHFFHRLRLVFLDSYQNLVLNEPDSAVRQSLKEAFVSLRRAAESNES